MKLTQKAAESAFWSQPLLFGGDEGGHDHMLTTYLSQPQRQTNMAMIQKCWFDVIFPATNDYEIPKNTYSHSYGVSW